MRRRQRRSSGGWFAVRTGSCLLRRRFRAVCFRMRRRSFLVASRPSPAAELGKGRPDSPWKQCLEVQEVHAIQRDGRWKEGRFQDRSRDRPLAVVAASRRPSNMRRGLSNTLRRPYPWYVLPPEVHKRQGIPCHLQVHSPAPSHFQVHSPAAELGEEGRWHLRFVSTRRRKTQRSRAGATATDFLKPSS